MEKTFRICDAKRSGIRPDSIFYRCWILFLARLSISEVPIIDEPILVEVVALFSREIDGTLIDSIALYTISLLRFRLSESSLELDHGGRRMIDRVRFCCIYFSRGSIGKLEYFFLKMRDVSLFENLERYREFSEWIVDISRITLVFGSGKV